MMFSFKIIFNYCYCSKVLEVLDPLDVLHVLRGAPTSN